MGNIFLNRKQDGEKIVLAVIEPARRLLITPFYSGHPNVYYKQLPKDLIITGVQESAIQYAEVGSVDDLVNESYFIDENNIVYFKCSGGTGPDDKFLFYTFKVFFSNKPINYSSSLSNNNSVFYMPLFKSTGYFGQEIDFINQKSEAIDSQGNIVFYNDFDFWKKNFNKYYWENRKVQIYSLYKDPATNDVLDLVFTGKIVEKGYSDSTITLKIKNVIDFLKKTISYNTYESLSNVYIKDEEKSRNIRSVYGKVTGFLPQNLSQNIPSGFLLGTTTFTNGSSTVTGSGTNFLTEIKVGDKIKITGSDIIYEVRAVNSNTSLSLNQTVSGPTITGLTYVIYKDETGYLQNRKWKIANHSLFKKENNIVGMYSQSELRVDGTLEFYEINETIWVGASDYSSGSFVKIIALNDFNNVITIDQNIAYSNIGQKTILPSVKNVFVNGIKLEPNRDYTVDSTNSTLELGLDAETKISNYTEYSNYEVGVPSTPPWNNGDTTVLIFHKDYPTNTDLSGIIDVIKPGVYIQISTNTTFYKVKSVSSNNTNLIVTLYNASSDQTVTTGKIRVKSFRFPEDPKLSCDVLGKTDDGTSNGNLLENPSDVIKDILLSSGVSVGDLYLDSFNKIKNIEKTKICLAIPQKQSGGTNENRYYINLINNSYLGLLSINKNLSIYIDNIKPNFLNSKTRIDHLNTSKYEVSTFNILQSQDLKIEYNYTEYVPYLDNELLTYSTADNENGKYLSQLTNTFNLKTAIRLQQDADNLVQRWKMIGSFSSNKVKINGYSNISSLNINDAVVFSAPNLTEGYGKSTNILGFVTSVKTNVTDTEIELLDLGNFNYRCAKIVNDDYISLLSEDTSNINQSGYYTENDGSINNDEDTLDTNLIW